MGYFETAVNRAYYAAFEAARAALTALGVPASKTHNGLIGQFGRHCVRSGIVSREFGSHLGELESARLLVDYKQQVPTADSAATALRIAEDVVKIPNAPV